jgi:hypothetical protein
VKRTDLERFRKLQALGCIACRNRLGQYAEPDIHHLLSGGRRRGHQYTIPLCPPHHRGVGHIPELHGPSLALAPRRFRQEFGSDEELLAQVNELISA